eukprot:TRINITY_DN22363_c0_g1_i1.p1 TRINITY_DN22363_c0_g1~~TRINITY_DN22363_c0_g1_i1.p1  ORF type:complete len:2052 (-),score=246.12 TRINITY_DN22363_c0_g1_i1:505-6537(-)
MLANSSKYDLPVLTIPSDFLQSGTKFTILLVVESRWGMISNETIELQKLNFPAPTVYILGLTDLYANRTERVSLLASGEPTECAGEESKKLAYRWYETSGKLDFKDWPEIITDVRTLVIPPFVLEPPVSFEETYQVYNFTVECFAANAPDRVSFASVGVIVRRSAISVYLTKRDRTIKRGDVLVLDARETQDPDYPTLPGMTFKGTFRWWCLNQSRLPCYGGFDPKGELLKIPFCRTNPDTQQSFTDGGRTFSQIVWEGEMYCRYARGVLMVRTTNFTVGQYEFAVEAESNDGRTDYTPVFIDVVNVPVPRVNLRLEPVRTKYPVTDQIRVIGLLESEIDPTFIITFSWMILVWDSNPAYNKQKAQAAENSDTPYTEAPFTFLDQTPVYDFENESQFSYRPESTDLVIKESVLQPSSVYKIRLIVTVNDGTTEVEGSQDVRLTTAGRAPSCPSGECLNVQPISAPMEVMRIIAAPNWQTTESPLSYSFGYIHNLGQQSVSVKFNTDKMPVKQIEVKEFPVGDPSSNYSLTIFVDVETPFGANTRMVTQVFSRPPENKGKLIDSKFEDAETSDPETVLKDLTTILNIQNAEPPPPGVPPSPEDVAVMTKVLEVMDKAADAVPVTAPAATQQAVVLSTVIDAGVKDTNSMNSLENWVLRSSEPEPPLFNIIDTTMMQFAFHMIGSILPDVAEGNPADLLATGQSLDMSILPPGSVQAKLEKITEAQKLSTLYGRKAVNHKMPSKGQTVTNDCSSAYCDRIYLECWLRSGRDDVFHMCCPAENPSTLCNDPPCWFRGLKCPMSNVRPGEARRLSGRPQMPPKLGRDKQGDFIEVDGWQDINHPSNPYGQSASSRALQSAARNDSLARETRIWQLEQDEIPLLKNVQNAIFNMEKKAVDDFQMSARREIDLSNMELGEAIRQQREDKEAKELLAETTTEVERVYSQIITRAMVLRDTICKQAIVQMANEPPLRFVTPGFIIYLGKTKNLSDVNPAFIFPDKYAVPPGVGGSDEGFSFVFLEYMKNIYGWSTSAPPGNRSQIITLLVMKASTTELPVKNEAEPIRVFADLALFSSALCMYWDRFAPNTAGGAWSTRGVLNDGDGGCLTTHLSDIGLFIDGRAPEVVRVGSAKSYFLEETEDVGMNIPQALILGFFLAIITICALWGFIRDELAREALRMGKSQRNFNLDGDGLTSPLSVNDPIAYDYVKSRNTFLAITFWHVVQRDHALLSPLFYNEKFTRPQRVLCVGVLVTGVFAINAAIYGLPHDGLLSQKQFVASGVVSGLLAFPVFVIMSHMFSTRPFAAQKSLIKRRTERDQMDAIMKMKNQIEHESSLRPGKYPPALPPSTMPSFAGGGTLLALSPAEQLTPANQALPNPVPTATSSSLGMLTAGVPSSLPTLPVAGLPTLPALQGPPSMRPSLSGTLGSTGGLAGLPHLPPLPQLKALPGTGSRPPPPPKNPPSGGFLQLPYGDAGTSTPPLQKSGGFGGSGFSSSAGPGPRGAAAGFGSEAMLAVEAGHSLPGAFVEDPLHRAMPPGAPEPLDADSEADRPGPRELQADGRHSMVPGVPPVPHAPPRTPSITRPSTPGSVGFPELPPGPPPPAPRIGGISNGVVHRGQAFVGLPPPFKPPTAQRQPPGMMPPPPPFAPPGKGPSGVPPPPFLGKPPVPAPPLLGGRDAFGLSSGMTPPPPAPPRPPPPPEEDPNVFLRRTRAQYMNRAEKLKQEMLLAESQHETPWNTPDWAFSLSLLCPYIACTVQICLHMFVHLAYSLKFARREEQNWYYACIIAICLILFVLEIIRSSITTIVELRKFEIRRRIAAGHGLVSKIRVMGGLKVTPELALKKAAAPRAKVPETGRYVPALTGAQSTPPPPMRPPPPHGVPRLPGGLPVAGAAPLPDRRLSDSAGQGTFQPLGLPALPGQSPGASARSSHSGTFKPPLNPAGAGQGGFVTSATQSLTEGLKASRVAAAPPPGSAPGSRQPSSRGVAPKPPTAPPPGRGTMAVTRHQSRQQAAHKIA